MFILTVMYLSISAQGRKMCIVLEHVHIDVIQFLERTTVKRFDRQAILLSRAAYTDRYQNVQQLYNHLNQHSMHANAGIGVIRPVTDR